MSNDTPAPAPSERCAKCGHTRFWAGVNGECRYVDSDGPCECGRSHDTLAPAPAPAPSGVLTREEYEICFEQDLGMMTRGEINKLLAHDAALRAEVERLKRERDEANEWRSRWCNEAEAHGKQSNANWERYRTAESQLDALRKAMREIRDEAQHTGRLDVMLRIAAAALKEAG